MTIQISNYEFNGPFENTALVHDRPGIYVILTTDELGNYSVIDVGESSEVKTRLDNHDRRTCWQRNQISKLACAVLYTTGTGNVRRQIEGSLRNIYNPICGIQ